MPLPVLFVIGLCLGCSPDSHGSDSAEPSGTEAPVDSGQPGDSTESPTPFERDLAPKLLACTGCHSGKTPSGELDLTDIWSVIDVDSGQADMVLLQSGSHLDSYLWHKVAGTQAIAGGLGTRMPVGSDWPEEDIDLLALWIDTGTPR